MENMSAFTCNANVTIAICTYNRANVLGDCLDSLLRQTVPPTDFHVLIIDNNSTDETASLLAKYADRFPSFRSVCETQQGLAEARNRAVLECSTAWLAFLDTDARAWPTWVATLLDVIAAGKFDAFGGPYHAWHRYGSPPPWLPEGFGTYVSPQSFGPLEGDTYIPGGNCCLRRQAALDVGLFPSVGVHAGDSCAYGDETQLFVRMGQTGYRLGYVPTLEIDHCVMPYKYRWQWQLKSNFAQGRSYERITGTSLDRLLLRLGWHCMRAALRMCNVLVRRKAEAPLCRTAMTEVNRLCWDAGALVERFCRGARRGL